MEAKLIDIEGLFDVAENHVPVCISIVNDLSPEEESAIRQIITKLYGLLYDFCIRYEVKQTQPGLKKKFCLRLPLLCQVFAGANSKSSDSSGKLDEKTKKEFDVYATEMTTLINELYAVCNT